MGEFPHLGVGNSYFWMMLFWFKGWTTEQYHMLGLLIVIAECPSLANLLILEFCTFSHVNHNVTRLARLE